MSSGEGYDKGCGTTHDPFGKPIQGLTAAQSLITGFLAQRRVHKSSFIFRKRMAFLQEGLTDSHLWGHERLRACDLTRSSSGDRNIVSEMLRRRATLCVFRPMHIMVVRLCRENRTICQSEGVEARTDCGTESCQLPLTLDLAPVPTVCTCHKPRLRHPQPKLNKKSGHWRHGPRPAARPSATRARSAPDPQPGLRLQPAPRPAT